ncbi:TonB-dependent siderophore receptor [Shewanella algae]|uniref:TonB-dependent siderophore receptor n=1 Tax=Shewanella algae TaxID=38313 RepID=UPI000B8B08B7|nr:TonB-dependent siderophore receptor [Shewanella algae]OXS00177.1 ferrichrome-iron receptor [Shewanella algae]
MTGKITFLWSAMTLALISSGVSVSHAEDASTASETTDIERLVIYSQGYRTTGSKSRLRPIESPMSFEVYDAELLKLRQADSVNEALRYVAGITPESRPTTTIFDQYTIRGFQSYRNYYDGLPLQYNGLWNLVPQVDAFATDSIEVLKGPTSVLYGSAPPGGMVNQVAKQPLGTEQTLLRGRIGTNQLLEFGVDHNGVASEDLDYRIVALGRKRDGQMQTTEEERWFVAPSLTWQLAERTSLNLNLYYQQDPRMIPSTPLPSKGTLSEASYGKLGSDAYAGDANWGNMDRDMLLAGYKLNHEFSDNLTFLQNLRYTRGESLQRNTYNSGLTDGDSLLARNAYFSNEAIEGIAVDNQLAWTISTGSLMHNLLFGIDYQYQDSDIDYGDTLGTDTAAIDLGAPNYYLLDPTRLAVNTHTERHDIKQRQLGFYVQDEISWQTLTILANLRHDSYKSTDAATKLYLGEGGYEEAKTDQQELTGRLAVIYRFDNGISPYVSYAESYEPTTGIDSLSGEVFKPTTASQWETGVKYASANGNTHLTVALFDITQQNLVVNTPDWMQYTQAGELNSRGFEFAFSTQLWDFLSLDGSYNQQDVEFTENALDPALVGKTPEWVAERQASLWATILLTDNLDLSAGVRHVGDSMLDDHNTGTVPGYTLVDLAASWRFGDSYRLGLTVSNLTDKRYVGACSGENNCWMGAERSIELGVEVDL